MLYNLYVLAAGLLIFSSSIVTALSTRTLWIRKCLAPILVGSGLALAPGIPILTVSANDKVSGGEQHRLLVSSVAISIEADSSETEDVSANVPSRRTVVTLDPKDSVIEETEFIGMKTLKLIPSYKYFKAISKEYSSRSSDYKEGDENLFAPFQ
jgi:hypothetical protein